MIVAETARTRLRELTVGDAAFVCALLNEPSFLRFIGDRNVRTTDDAARFIETRYRQSYVDNGYGLYAIESRADDRPLGLCGFVRRPSLLHADLGFALLSPYEGMGYAHEAAAAVLAYGREVLGLSRVLAIAQGDNSRSHTLLLKLGFVRDGTVTMPGDATPLALFVHDA
jgi:RimJ/RimL family protein N-acetyltransferase